MYLLMGWRKPGDEGYEVIAASECYKELMDTADSLNHVAGYQPGCGVWNGDVKGCFHVIHVRVSSRDDVLGKDYRKGVNFLKHEERWKETV